MRDVFKEGCSKPEGFQVVSAPTKSAADERFSG